MLPWGGGNYLFGWDNSRTSSNSIISSYSPALASSLHVAFSQPLLRDFKIDPARAQLEVSRRNREITDTRLLETSVATKADAERAYWLLVSSLALVDVQQRSLDLALELERTNRARVDVGQSPPLDLVAAQAEVAQRRENLIVARTSARQSEDLLRTIAVDPKRDDYWALRLEPTDVTPAVGPPPDVDAAVRRALSERTDLLRARKEIQNAETGIALSRSQSLPDLRAAAELPDQRRRRHAPGPHRRFPRHDRRQPADLVRERAWTGAHRRLSNLDARTHLQLPAREEQRAGSAGPGEDRT